MITVNTPTFNFSTIFATYLWDNHRPVQKGAIGPF